MNPRIVEEALFWKHLSDTLLDHMNINKDHFYDQIEPIKSVWDLEDFERVAQEIQKAQKNKTQYIKESFKSVLVEMGSVEKN